MNIKILTSDDWEALYINGESVEQRHKIPRNLLAEIMMDAKQVDSYMEYWVDDKDDEYAYKYGRFPEKWGELSGSYE